MRLEGVGYLWSFIALVWCLWVRVLQGAYSFSEKSSRKSSMNEMTTTTADPAIPMKKRAVRIRSRTTPSACTKTH
jgi:hypothetical protein